MGIDRKPSALAMSCPRITSSCGLTTGMAGLPMCCTKGITNSGAKGNCFMGKCAVSSLYSGGCMPWRKDWCFSQSIGFVGVEWTEKCRCHGNVHTENQSSASFVVREYFYEPSPSPLPSRQPLLLRLKRLLLVLYRLRPCSRPSRGRETS